MSGHDRLRLSAGSGPRVAVGPAWVGIGDVLELLNHPGHADQKSHGRKKKAAKTGADAVAAVPYQMGAAGNDPKVDRALNRYAGQGYRQVNDQLRGGNMFGPSYREQTDAWVADIDAAMGSSRLTDNVVVHRGVPSAAATFGSARENYVGMRFRDDAFVSTSANRSTAEDFAGEVLMKVSVPRGTRAAALTARGEQEILLDRGLTFRVTGQQDVPLEGGLIQRHLDVEVVP